MMKLVNFVIPSNGRMILEIKVSESLYLLIKECLYSMRETVICLVTVPIVEESGLILEVTSITTMEVASVELLFHSS